MVSSINSNDSDNMQLLMVQMYQKVNAANTDGIAGLSKGELSSIDMGNDVGGAAFMKSLSEQFDALDSDGNGQLTANEVSAAKLPTDPMGPPPGLNIASSDDDDSTNLTGSVSATGSSSTDSTSSASSSNSMEDLISSLLEKLLQSLSQSFNNNGDSTSSGLTSGDSTGSDLTGGNSDKISSLVSSSDTDKNGSLSLDELKSINTSGHPHEARFVNKLIDNFSKYDTDGDGNLSQSEISSATPKDFSQQATTAMSENSNNLADAGSSFDNIKAFMDKLVSAYKASGGISTIASSLHIAG